MADNKAEHDGSGKGDAPPRRGPVEESSAGKAKVPREIGGRDGPEPTRYGDWEKNGRCIDF